MIVRSSGLLASGTRLLALFHDADKLAGISCICETCCSAIRLACSTSRFLRRRRSNWRKLERRAAHAQSAGMSFMRGGTREDHARPQVDVEVLDLLVDFLVRPPRGIVRVGIRGVCCCARSWRTEGVWPRKLVDAF